VGPRMSYDPKARRLFGRIATMGCVALTVTCDRRAEHGAVIDSGRTTSTNAPVSAIVDSSSGMVVTERGIGPIQAGTTIEAASATLGGALVLPAGADTAGCTYARWHNGPTGVRVMVEGGRIARVDVDSAGIRTAAGVGVGDTEAQVQRLYRGRAKVTPSKYEVGHYLTVVDSADTTFALVFESRAGRVTRFRAGRRPQVEYVEGCG
jgi:hypothetical protein